MNRARRQATGRNRTGAGSGRASAGLARLLLIAVFTGAGAGAAVQAEPMETLSAEWGGHVRFRGNLSWPEEGTLYDDGSADPDRDTSADTRLKGMVFFGAHQTFEAHCEMVLVGGDQYRKNARLRDLLGQGPLQIPLPGAVPEDDRRLLDLTKILSEGSGHVLYHRLDRLVWTWFPDWGVVRAGRQAVTWGNGLLFNPTDLFNPFAPTDIERDYKLGDDMLSVQVPTGERSDLHGLYVARRDLQTGEPSGEASSLAGKLHTALGTTEFDLMVAKHYGETVLGLGASGYLGEAVWRTDVLYSTLDSDKDHYVTLVANLDRSWMWWGKNFYGFVEGYYNGLGEENPVEALQNPDLMERIARGELFTLGRLYLGGHLRVEMHPLVNVMVTLLGNLEDSSGLGQPRVVWEPSQNIQVTAGASVSWGGTDTEWGGFRLPGYPAVIRAPDRAFIWITRYF